MIQLSNGKLLICPTPIGNLEDITLRVLRVLREVDLIAAEDTRHTIKLLNHYEISKPLTSYHQHNRHHKGEALLKELLEGKHIALVSDAGMPGISDPGEDLVALCIENDIDVEVLPGATAGILALVASGISTERFVFEGFLDRDKKKRRERLERIKNEDRTIILYEAPHRLTDTLKDLLQHMGNRKLAIARELTKKYEEIVRGSLEEVIQHFNENTPKGEFVIICEGAEEGAAPQESFNREVTVKAHLIELMAKGLDKKEAIKEVARLRGLPKREVYNEALDLNPHV